MRKHNILSKIFVLLVLLYLYVPIIVLMVLSLNESRYNSLPFEFTTKWYEDMISNESLLLAAKNSLLLALITGIICTVLATLFTLGQRYLSKKVSGTFHSIVMMPMSIPWLIMGLSLLLMIRSPRVYKEHGVCTGGTCDHFSSLRSPGLKSPHEFPGQVSRGDERLLGRRSDDYVSQSYASGHRSGDGGGRISRVYDQFR